jgi:hypothetical protein
MFGMWGYLLQPFLFKKYVDHSPLYLVVNPEKSTVHPKLIGGNFVYDESFHSFAAEIWKQKIAYW